MRRSVYKRYLEGPFGKLKLDEINPAQLMKHCESIREKGAAAPAVQVREIVLLVYRFAVSKDKSLTVTNPAEAIRPSDIATFKARDRALNPTEIRRFLAALDTTATAATLRLALRASARQPWSAVTCMPTGSTSMTKTVQKTTSPFPAACGF